MDPINKHSGTPASTLYDDGLEFELTDFEEARRVLAGESTSTPSIRAAAVVSPAEWKRLRRATLPTDRALSGQAIDWLLKLPPALRPQHLGTQFPRIAHALAVVWDEPDERRAALRKLIAGDRKGRKGFPPQVRDELIALRNGQPTP